MKDYLLVKEVLCKFNVNKVIKASQVYKKYLINVISESSYYKILERMYKKNEISKLGKGLYYFANKDEYGDIPISENEIIKDYISDNKGMITGYKMFNILHLTTQVPKNIEIYTNCLNQKTENILYFKMNYVNLVFTEEVVKMIQCLEILQNYNRIEDLNEIFFLDYIKKFAKIYNDHIFDIVYKEIKYKKKTIAFLKQLLDDLGIKNTLNKYLSNLSKYKIKNIEEIYESSQQQIFF